MAIAFDSAASQSHSGGNTSYTHTVGTGLSNSIMFCFISQSDYSAITVGTPTYNSVSMTSIGSRDQGQNKLYVYYLLNPASGSNTVATTQSPQHQRAVGTVVYSGVDQDTPYDTPDWTGSTTSTPSDTHVTASSGMWCLGAASTWHTGGYTPSSGADQNSRVNEVLNVTTHREGIVIDDESTGAPTTHTMSWTGFPNRDTNQFTVGLNFATSDGAPPASGMMFSLAGLAIPAATLVGLYKAGAVAI
jgi:hypothetical protein